MTTRPTPPAVTLEPLLDLQRLVAGIRWRRRLWTSLALTGLLLGLVFSVLAPAGSTATTVVYVVHEDEQAGDRETVMKTDVAVLQTTQVAAAALALLGITDERAEDFVRDYAGASTAANVLEITVSGAGRADAVRRAQALADAFIDTHVQRVEDSAAAESRALLDRRAQAENDLAELNEEIARGPVSTPGAGPEDAAAQLGALYAERSALGTQIQELAQRAEDAAVGAPRVAAGTQIIDAPRVTSRSAVVSAAINGVLGLFVGLTGGLVLAAVASVVADRPVLRRDITAHLGASVIAQLPAPHRGPRRLWRRSRPVVERRRVAETLARVVATAPGGVSLLEIGCPGPAAELAHDTVTNLTRERPVALVDDLPGQPVGAAVGRSDDDSVRLVDGPDALDPGGDDGSARERLVGVGSVVPGTAWTDLRRLGAETVLIVRAGHADTTWLHTVARQLADLEIVVIGVVLVHPDPRDRSDGTLWDGLHTALRGRARPATSTQAVPPATPPVVERTTPPATGAPGSAPGPDGSGGPDTPPATERVADRESATPAAEPPAEEPGPAGTTAAEPPAVSAAFTALAALGVSAGRAPAQEPVAGGPTSSGTVPSPPRPSPVPRNGTADRDGRINGKAHGRNNGTTSTQEVS